ncbi:hypothetical protein KEM55_006970, partial [Ascosphaera atra]
MAALNNNPSTPNRGTRTTNPHLPPAAGPSTPSRPRRRGDLPAKNMVFTECQEGSPAAPIHRSIRVETLAALEVMEAEFVNGRTARCDLVWKADATPRDATTLDGSQLIALAMQLGGKEGRLACRPCQVGNPFLQCVGSDVAGHGACTGCKFLVNPGRCDH